MNRTPGSYIHPEKQITCKRCHTSQLGWAKSSKTGRFYLCETFPSQDDDKRLSGVRWIAPWVPHNCEKSIQARDALNAAFTENV